MDQSKCNRGKKFCKVCTATLQFDPLKYTCTMLSFQGQKTRFYRNIQKGSFPKRAVIVWSGCQTLRVDPSPNPSTHLTVSCILGVCVRPKIIQFLLTAAVLCCQKMVGLRYGRSVKSYKGRQKCIFEAPQNALKYFSIKESNFNAKMGQNCQIFLCPLTSLTSG